MLPLQDDDDEDEQDNDDVERVDSARYLVATDGRWQMDNPPPPLIRQGEVTEDPDVPGGYVAEVMAELAGEYKIILKY